MFGATLQLLALLLFLPGPNARLQLLEKDLNYQLELLRESQFVFILQLFSKRSPVPEAPRASRQD